MVYNDLIYAIVGEVSFDGEMPRMSRPQEHYNIL